MTSDAVYQQGSVSSNIVHKKKMKKRVTFVDTVQYAESATVWVFVFSLFILKEKATILKCVSVALFIAGVIGITLADGTSGSDSDYPNAVTGDILMIVSALMWALYEVLTSKYFSDSSRTVVNTYISLVALWNIILSPIFFIVLHFSGFEKFELPSLQIFGMLTLSASVAFALNYLINWGCAMTSPLFVRSGELLTIPATLLFDIIFKHIPFPLVAIPGFACIVAGFVVMLFVENKAMKEKDNIIDTPPTTHKSTTDDQFTKPSSYDIEGSTNK
eukprot:gene4015-4650_t